MDSLAAVVPHARLAWWTSPWWSVACDTTDRQGSLITQMGRPSQLQLVKLFAVDSSGRLTSDTTWFYLTPDDTTTVVVTLRPQPGSI